MTYDFINQLENEHNQRNQDKVTLSIRLSVKEDMILYELANAFETTRQEIISRLIQDYVVKGWEQKHHQDKDSQEHRQEDEDTPREVQFYLLNTNSVNDIDDHNFMMSEKVAAAFEDGYKEKINRIKKGDYVFLYASNQGIVAYGKASGEVKKKHHYGVEDKTFFQYLDDFTDLSQSPITARKIKSVLGRSFPFAQTLSRISDGEKLLAEVQSK